MRIVLDTNVVVSALLWRGLPRRLIEVARSRDDTTLFTSLVLLEEFAGILRRPAMTRRLAVIGRQGSDVFADYVAMVEVVSPRFVPAVIALDADDDHVVAAAVSAEADVICSGDGHLLAVGSYGTIRIVSPADLLVMLSTSR